jgi:PEP-CTERM motif
LTVPATVNALAQAAGPGQKFVTPGDAAYAFSTVLPDKADVATLIGGAGNVADALLGPDDKIFGTAILGESGDDSTTFDFSFRGDLLLGDVDDDRVTNLGFFSGPIHLTLDDPGVFVLGGAVPEPSTWAMLLLGFASLGYAGYRRTREPRAT